MNYQGVSWADQQRHERALEHHQHLMEEARTARLLASRTAEPRPPRHPETLALSRVWGWLLTRLRSAG
ncbi:hypothetical protein [Deinococcus apachensis]|uniref:hypothetical protein n=1 Tax=Deinococcus apachensis TaxID=309886 RepID=UPI0003629B2A|nr:hypothetical protein [Deinococcus apachensis]